MGNVCITRIRCKFIYNITGYIPKKRKKLRHREKKQTETATLFEIIALIKLSYFLMLNISYATFYVISSDRWRNMCMSKIMRKTA